LGLTLRLGCFGYDLPPGDGRARVRVRRGGSAQCQESGMDGDGNTPGAGRKATAYRPGDAADGNLGQPTAAVDPDAGRSAGCAGLLSTAAAARAGGLVRQAGDVAAGHDVDQRTGVLCAVGTGAWGPRVTPGLAILRRAQCDCGVRDLSRAVGGGGVAVAAPPAMDAAGRSRVPAPGTPGPVPSAWLAVSQQGARGLRSAIWPGRTPRVGLPAARRTDARAARRTASAESLLPGPGSGSSRMSDTAGLFRGAQRDVVAAWEHHVVPATDADRRSAVDLVRRWVMDGRCVYL